MAAPRAWPRSSVDCGLTGRMLLNQRGNALEDRVETRRQVGIGGLDDAARHIRQRLASLVDNAEPGHAQARVDAENSHGVPVERGACDTNSAVRKVKSTLRKVKSPVHLTATGLVRRERVSVTEVPRAGNDHGTVVL